MDDLYIYRSCNRPKYVKSTLMENLERTSLNGMFLAFDNSEAEHRGEIAELFQIAQDQCGDRRDFSFEFSPKAKIGGTKAIYKSVDKWAATVKNPRYVFVIDDDSLVPKPNGFLRWDQVLIEMLDAGWDVVAHPWAQTFRDKETKEIRGVKGYPYSGVGGACSGFRYDFYKKNRMQQATLIRGYNEWMVRNDQGKNGYSYRGQMVFEHIDRPDHPLSLRDTEYCEWSDEMYYERFARAKKEGKTRPKGMDGVW